jgi:hypothetical protein
MLLVSRGLSMLGGGGGGGRGVRKKSWSFVNFENNCSFLDKIMTIMSWIFVNFDKIRKIFVTKKKKIISLRFSVLKIRETFCLKTQKTEFLLAF